MAPSASRVLAFLELLQSHHRLTGVELARRLDVDERTVRRYAGTLADLGIPVIAARGRYGGYRLAPGFKLPPLMFTDDEAVAVVLGLIAADRIGLGTGTPGAGAAPVSTSASASAEAKISRVLPAALAERLSTLQDSLGFTQERRDGAVRPATGTLLALSAATRAHRRVDLSYRSAGRTEVSRREVDPYGLVFHAGRWYVVGLDHHSGEIRSFRLERIVSADAGGVTFEPPPNFDAVGHVARTLAGAPWAHRVEVLLETDLSQARRRIPATVAELTETADGVLLRATANSLPGMAQMLAGLGWPFTILHPYALRAAVTELAARLIENAAR